MVEFFNLKRPEPDPILGEPYGGVTVPNNPPQPSGGLPVKPVESPTEVNRGSSRGGGGGGGGHSHGGGGSRPVTPDTQQVNFPDITSPSTTSTQVIKTSQLPQFIDLPGDLSYPQFMSGTMSGDLSKQFEDARRRGEFTDKITNVAQEAFEYTLGGKFYSEPSRKTAEQSVGLGGLKKQYSYEKEGYDTQLPQITRGTSGYDYSMLSYEDLGRLNFGGGLKAAQQQAQIKAQISADFYTDAQARNIISQAQEYYDMGLLSKDEAQDWANRAFKEQVSGKVKQIYEDEFTKAQKEFTKGRESVSFQESLPITLAYSIPFAGLGFVQGARGGIGFLTKATGIGSLGKDIYSSTTDLIKGDFTKFPDRALNLAIGATTYSLGYKSGYEGIYKPKVELALKRSQFFAEPNSQGVDFDIAKYSFDEKGFLQMQKLVDQGYDIAVVKGKLVPGVVTDKPYLPEVNLGAIGLIDRKGNVIATNIIGRETATFKGTKITKDLAGKSVGIVEGDIIDTIGSLRIGKFGEKDLNKVTQIDFTETTSILQSEKLNAGTLAQSGESTTKIFYEDKPKSLPFKESYKDIKAIEDDIARLEGTKPKDIIKSAFEEDIAIRKVFYERLPSGEIIDTGGLVGGARARVSKGTSATIPEGTKPLRVFRDIKDEPKSPSRVDKIINEIERKTDIDMSSDSTLLVGEKTDTLSQSLYGHGYGINWGGGFKRALQTLGEDVVKKGEGAKLFPHGDKIKRGDDIITRYIPRGRDDFRFRINPRQRDFTSLSNKEDSLLKDINRNIDKNISGIRSREGFGTGIRENQIQKIGEPQITELKLGEVTRITPRFTQPPTPRVSFPGFRFDTDSKKRKSIMALAKAYEVRLKSKGKFKTVGLGLPRGKALMLGSDKALNTLARSFKIVESGLTSEPDINFGVDPFKFRGYKIRKGQRIGLLDQFIQRQSSNLKSYGERREIKLARRAKKGFGSYYID